MSISPLSRFATRLGSCFPSKGIDDLMNAVRLAQNKLLVDFRAARIMSISLLLLSVPLVGWPRFLSQARAIVTNAISGGKCEPAS